MKLLILDFDGTMTTTLALGPGNVPITNVNSTNVVLFRNMTQEQHIQNFGGPERLVRMMQLFDRLAEIDVQLRILSMGAAEAIIIALSQAGLVKYFTTPGGEPGNLVFGSDVPPLNDDEADKLDAVQGFMDDEGFGPQQVAYLDDDKAFIDDPDAGEGERSADGEYEGGNRGIALILETGHAKIHQGYFEASQQWIEDICGLTES